MWKLLGTIKNGLLTFRSNFNTINVISYDEYVNSKTYVDDNYRTTYIILYSNLSKYITIKKYIIFIIVYYRW